ncbi:MAG: GvpL/GvpF family gas vesicle protein [Candidatus Coatesbacteria bacterium]|nr:GvpL/GvpF family gas vesicle protein [Candidatus Coatesbacteria bacterium]
MSDLERSKGILAGPDEAQGLYLYGFARAARLPLLKLAGVDARYPVSQWTYKEVAAVASQVVVTDFSGPSAETNLKDLTWVGPRACRHQEVVEAVMQHSPVLPTRFGTIFSSSQRMMELCEHHHDTISRFLSDVDNKAEWALKGFLNRAQARKSLGGEKERLASVSSGKQYFMQKQAAAEVEQQLNQRLKAILTEIWKDLGQYAAGFCERKVLSRDATGLDVDMVLNWAFLLSRDSQEVFAACLNRAQAAQEKHGLRFELSGPWPPYSFSPILEAT